jgi:pilus assembly protein Flp/PilA
MKLRFRASLPSALRQPALTLKADETGATGVEYGLICALIVLAILGGIKTLGASIAAMPLQSIVDAIHSVIP